MMRNLIVLLTTSLLFASQISAAAPTPTVTPTKAGTPTPTNKIDDLKERLATKVAELRQTQRKAIYGTIKAVSISTFTVETESRELKIELTDDLKVFQMIKGKRTDLTGEDLAEGDIVSVFGEYDTGLDLLRAKVVVIQNKPLTRVSGVVSEIDRKEFTVTITTSGGQEYVIDIEKTTNALMFDREKGLIKGGFSKLETGRTVHVVGTPVAKQENRISAARLIDLGNLTGATPTPTPTEEPSPAATATATPKATPKASVTPKPTATPTP